MICTIMIRANFYVSLKFCDYQNKTSFLTIFMQVNLHVTYKITLPI